MVQYNKYLGQLSSMYEPMMTSSNGNMFRVTGHLCGEFSGEFLAQRPVTRSIDVFFDLRRIKRLYKESWGWWFETLSGPLWRHSNEHADKEMARFLLIICRRVSMF